MHDRSKCLWYRRPAESWYESLPLGNGRLGAMASCGVNLDRLWINEESLWAGKPGECERPDAGETIKKLQTCLFAGDSLEAEKLLEEGILPEKRWFGSYQAFGELDIRFQTTVEYDHYERRLDLDQGVVQAECTMMEEEKELTWRKEYLVSAPHQVLAIRYAADRPMNLEISLSREQEAQVIYSGDGRLTLKGKLGGDGIAFVGMLQVVPQGGTMRMFQTRVYAPPVLQIHGATEVEIFLAARTSYRSEQYWELCEDDLCQAVKDGYENIRNAHIAEYRSWYDRFDFGLGVSAEEAEDLTTYQRLQRVKEGWEDPEFYALLMHYYRYLLLSSSRPGCLPSNLQGIWNDKIHAPWESDYHMNINLEINYWPTEAWQLGECHTALFDWLKDVSESGAKTAREYYGVGGWTVHHASNLFAHTAPCAVPAGLWPMGGGWIVRHLYEHDLYNGDCTFLKEQAWPLMKGAAQFLMEFLQEAPDGVEGTGYLVTVPSHSPENKFYGPDGRVTTFTYGATMDIQIIEDLFRNCLDVIDRLKEQEGSGFEAEFAEHLEETLQKLPPTKISARTGGIQEWINDFEAVDPGHRHLSHLYGLYPARLISWEKTPELAAAAKRTLEYKLCHNYDGQGWSYGWMSCLWSRLGEPEQAYKALRQVVQERMLHNLFVDAHGNAQVGDGEVIPAAILEMLVQFDGEKIHLLPALPEAWKDGWVKGLKTVGGYLIDMVWKDGKITECQIHEEQVFHPYPIEWQETI